MGRMKGIRGPRGVFGLMAGMSGLLMAASIAALGPARQANAGWPWTWPGAKAACGHPGCHRNRCLATDGWAGNWYWMRSPDQEQRVIMARYNRYCIRCHGIDGRGVWDIPDVPDFTDPRWQQSRPDPQIVNILMEGRGAVMPSFRGTLSLEESWAMAHYLRTFVPGTEAARPDVGRAAPARTAPATPARPNSVAELPPLPTPARPQSPAR
jgi:Cytochrome C oxidase, cbb3-type, subunit III